jgi:hypothetical protein
MQEDGTFARTDVLPGEVRVSVVDDKAESGMEPPPNVALPPGGTRSVAVKRPPIPIRSQDPDTSGRVYTIPPRVKSMDIAINLE